MYSFLHSSFVLSIFALLINIEKRMKKFIIAFVGVLAVLCTTVGCRSVKQAVAMKDCDYSFGRIGDISFMGIGKTRDPLSTMSAGKITLATTKLLTGVSQSAPLNFTLYLKVTNPNKGTAAVNHLTYNLTADDVEFANGETDQAFSVAGGETAELALPVTIDLKSIANKEHLGAVIRVALEMMGLGGKEKAVLKANVKPTVGFEKAVFTSPAFIPIVIEYGGK